MRRYSSKLVAVAAFTVSLLVAPFAHAQTFSLSPGSPTIVGSPGDIFLGGPALLYPGDPAMFNANAFSYGRVIGDFSHNFALEFSISPSSSGAPSAIPGFNMAFEESSGLVGGFPVGSGGDHPADIYLELGTGGNLLVPDGDGVPNPNAGLVPGGLGLVEPFGTPGDDVDAWDRRSGPGLITGIWFSLDAATAGAAGFAPSDVLFSPPISAGPPFYDTPGIPVSYVAGTSLGLAPTDDIDALIYFDDTTTPGLDPLDLFLISLAPGSPTLGAGGFSPADVLITSLGGAPVLHRPASAMGLLPTDDIDALDITNQVIIPEPATAGLLLLGLAGLAAARRRD